MLRFLSFEKQPEHFLSHNTIRYGIVTGANAVHDYIIVANHWTRAAQETDSMGQRNSDKLDKAYRLQRRALDLAPSLLPSHAYWHYVAPFILTSASTYDHDCTLCVFARALQTTVEEMILMSQTRIDRLAVAVTRKFTGPDRNGCSSFTYSVIVGASDHYDYVCQLKDVFARARASLSVSDPIRWICGDLDREEHERALKGVPTCRELMSLATSPAPQHS